MEFISLVIWLLCGFACFSMAKKQGRNEILAAALGVLFGVFGIIGYAIAGNKTVVTPTPQENNTTTTPQSNTTPTE